MHQAQWIKDENERSLLPLLFGAAIGFPFGYIVSNTNKNNYQMPYYPPVGYMPYQMPYYPQYYIPYPYQNT